MHKQILFRKLISSLIWVLILLCITWGIGIGGFLLLDYTWIDAIYNSALVITSMGMQSTMVSSAGKLFVAIYGIICNIILINMMGIAISPIIQYAVSIMKHKLPFNR